MTLDEYLVSSDLNLFWKLSPGEHFNLLEEAIERVEDMFVVLLKRLMVEENNYTEDKADELIKKHPNIIMQGILQGPSALRAVVMAIEREERL